MEYSYDLGKELFDRVFMSSSDFNNSGFTNNEIIACNAYLQKYPNDPYNKIKELFCFRVKIYFSIIMMSDAVHDFTENDKRNALTSENKIKLLHLFITFYFNKIKSFEIEWLNQYLIVTYLNGIEYLNLYDNEIYKLFENSEESIKKLSKTISSDTEDIITSKEWIDKYTLAANCISRLGITFTDLREISKAYTFNAGIGRICSKKPLYLKSYLSLIYKNVNKAEDALNSPLNILLSVDADKSKFSTANITTIACDQYAINGSDFKILRTIASDYDSASGSVMESIINDYAVEYDINKKDIYINQKDSTRQVQYTLKIGGETFMQYAYLESEQYNGLGQIINDYYSNKYNKNKKYDINISQFKDAYKKLKKFISDNYYSNVKLKDAAAGEFIDKEFNWSSSQDKFSNLAYDGKKINYDKLNQNISNNFRIVAQKLKINIDQLFDIMFERKNSSILKIINYFGIEELSFDSTNINSAGQVSVNELTTNNLFIDGINAGNINSVIYLTSYKTIGDLGQIIATQTFNAPNYSKLFISFDRICSMISSLFIPASIYEKGGKNVANSPFLCFGTYYEIQEKLAILLLSSKRINISDKDLISERTDEGIKFTALNDLANLASLVKFGKRKIKN